MPTQQEVALGEQTLPQSGVPITMLVLVALGLIATGEFLRRGARTAARVTTPEPGD